MVLSHVRLIGIAIVVDFMVRLAVAAVNTIATSNVALHSHWETGVRVMGFLSKANGKFPTALIFITQRISQHTRESHSIVNWSMMIAADILLCIAILIAVFLLSNE